MFNDTYGLETATLNGSKTRTSRIEFQTSANFTDMHLEYTKINSNMKSAVFVFDDSKSYKSKYGIGEIVAIAQRYKDIFPNADFEMIDGKFITESEGWNNKMFVKAEYMPHQIQITDIKLERLQDISDDDCLKEGICLLKDDKSINWKYYGVDKRSLNILGYTPKEAFYSLIEKVCGKGTWRKNPWTVVYYYKLIK